MLKEERTHFESCMTRRERNELLIYLPIHIGILPALLSWVFYRFKGTPDDPIMILIYYLIGAVYVVMTCRKFFARNAQNAMEEPGNSFLSFLFGFLMILCMTLLLNFVKLKLGVLNLNANNNAALGMAEDNFLAVFLSAVLLAPLVEEPLFRGVLFGEIYKNSKVWAYVISMLCFGLYHVWMPAMNDGWKELLSIVDYLPASFALAWTYEHSDSIWASVLIHMLVNALGLITA